MRHPLLFLACLAVLSPGPARAQDLQADIAALRSELTALRREVDALKTQLAQREPVSATSPPSLEVLQAQVAEQAQTKVESASRFPLKIAGSIVSTTFLNSGNPNWLDIPNIARPTAAGTDDGTFTSSLRQSRLGFEVAGLELGAWRAGGALTFDFFGGIPGVNTGQTMGLPRLLYAFARLETNGVGVLVGQDEAIVAPRNPTSLSAFASPALIRSGNLYMRVPQVRVEGRVRTGSHGTLRAIGGITAPIAGDMSDTYTFIPPALAGERSERPAVQGRAVWEFARDERHTLSLGVSGHQSSPEFTDGEDSWIGAIDLDAQWRWLGIAGEAFTSDHAGAFTAGLGQQARSRGGWMEVRMAPAARWLVVAGGGTDRVSDAAAQGVTLARNASGFGALRVALTPELMLGMEYFHLQTTPVSGAVRRNNHLNWVLRYDF